MRMSANSPSGRRGRWFVMDQKLNTTPPVCSGPKIGMATVAMNHGMLSAH